jgi:signal transduction histidine kinase
LFWTFAGSFLLVLVLAAVLQVVVVVAVVRPLTERWIQDRAELRVQKTAQAIRAAFPVESPEALERILREEVQPEPHILIVFRYEDGRAVSGQPLPRGLRRLLRSGALLDSTLPVERPGRPPLAGHPEGKHPPWGPGDPESRRHRLRLLSREEIEAAPGAAGEIFAFTVQPRIRLWPTATPRPLLLFLPLAVLIAGAAGLVIFRLLTRRLKAMEALATRVTEGDFTARVDEAGGDEIARLGSRLNQMTEALARARERETENDRLRRRLLADISHELGTPLTSIRGYTETILDPNVPVSDEERRAYLQSVLGEAERMDLLTQDLLELTRLEAGAIPFQRERLDWAALCRNTLERFQGRFREAGLTLAWSGSEEEAWISADGRRLEQVLENLLVNALRYVPSAGAVTVSMSRGSDTYILSVADDGPGIPAQDIPNVFDRFYRADPARSQGGSGLGLAIVKEIVLRHGGTVTAEPGTPQGILFRVEVPGEKTTSNGRTEA